MDKDFIRKRSKEMLNHYGVSDKLVQIDVHSDMGTMYSNASATKNKHYVRINFGLKGHDAIKESTLHHELGHAIDLIKDRDRGIGREQLRNETKRKSMIRENRAVNYAKPFDDRMSARNKPIAKWFNRAGIEARKHPERTHYYDTEL